MVSQDFVLLRHSSPSFGSQHVCSDSNLSPKIMIGRWCTLRLPPQPCGIHFHCAFGFATQTLAHMLDSLVRVSRRVVYNHFVRVTILQLSEEAEQNCTSIASTRVLRGYNTTRRWLPPPQACHANAIDANPKRGTNCIS